MGNGASWVRLVWALDFSKIAAGLHASVVYGLEDLLVELTCLRGFKRHTESHEGVRKTIHTKTNRAVTHVREARLRDRVIVAVNDTVEVNGDDLGHIMQLLEVVFAVLDE